MFWVVRGSHIKGEIVTRDDVTSASPVASEAVP